MNIHDVNKEDDVRGVIVGRMACLGRLTYDGRSQRGVMYADDVDELHEKARLLKREIAEDMGPAFNVVFPSDNWRLVIIQ